MTKQNSTIIIMYNQWNIIFIIITKQMYNLERKIEKELLSAFRMTLP